MKIGFLLLGLTALASAFTPSSYPRSLVLDPSYTLYWRVEGEYINLAIKAQTTGWVGFGLAEPTSGSMPGSDILTGYVDNTGVNVFDRHALAYEMPILDECQNWEAIGGEESEGWTIVEARRKLISEDPQDRSFVTGNNRIVWSYGSSDNFGYHQDNRGSWAIDFFNENPPNPLEELRNDPEVNMTYFIHDNYEIPATVTTYHDMFYEIPPLESDAHLIAFEAVIDPNTVEYVHHFVVLGCPEAAIPGCSILWGWAPGVDSIVLPKEAGIRIGNSDNTHKFLRIQTHFDNPKNHTNIYDNSGVIVYTTFKLRQYDAGTLQMGDVAVTNKNPIPAWSVLHTEYNCPSECTSQWSHPITVFADFLHMHEIGKKIWTTLWRGNQSLGYTNRIEFWDFGYQQTTLVNTTIYPGDRLQTHCIFENNVPLHGGPVQDRQFGKGSHEEMCMNYVFYYPRVEQELCGFFNAPNTPPTANFTLCGKNPIQGMNPQITDPPGGELTTFGNLTHFPTWECDVVSASNLIQPFFALFVAIFFFAL